jgi:hypothetical protein
MPALVSSVLSCRTACTSHSGEDPRIRGRSGGEDGKDIVNGNRVDPGLASADDRRFLGLAADNPRETEILGPAGLRGPDQPGRPQSQSLRIRLQTSDRG